MALSEESWEEILYCVVAKGAETEQRIDTTQGLLVVMRENWEILCSRAACSAYVTEKKLVDLQAQKTAKEAEVVALAAEIAALGG